jgi:uncharacterized protein
VDPVTRRKLARGALAVVVALALAALGVVAALWSFQDRLIYLSPHYAERGLQGLPSGLLALRDPREKSSVVGFYRPPLLGGVPARLWLVFGGNGDLALRYDPLLSPSATAQQGFLMIEYPGYGARAGQPSPESLLSGSEASLSALAAHLGTTTADLEARSSVLGYSLGSAAALQYAERHPVQRIILFAPFTSMLEMARLTVGSPLCQLLRHRYDNVSALNALERKQPTPLTILHGSRDALIPHTMGERLAAQVPGSRFELVPDAGHADVLDVAEQRLHELLSEP